MFIKYLVKKEQCLHWMLMVGFDYNLIKEKELNDYLKNGWILVEKRYYLYSNIRNNYRRLNHQKKSTFILSIISIILTLIFGVISLVF